MEDEIMNCRNPALHQKFGKKVRNFDSAVWDSVAQEIVYQGNLAKFSQYEGNLLFPLSAPNYPRIETRITRHGEEGSRRSKSNGQAMGCRVASDRPACCVSETVVWI